MKPIEPLKTAADNAAYVVQYRAYDPRLPDVFEKIKRLIQAAAGSFSIEPVGSSSIPGLGGRNAIDIAVVAPQPKHAQVRRVLYELGFEDAPFPHFLPLLVGQIPDEGRIYQILLYVVSPDSSTLADWLKFRDHMRSHPDDAEAYDAVKRDAIAEGKAAGDDYQEAKNPFLATIAAKLKVGRPD
jgi:GrpB-like predicted nucleotidyltransferase (UPF0157 family)